MIQFRIAVNDLLLRLRVAKAVAAFQDLRPEMKQVGDYLIDDAGERLQDRDTEYNQYATGRLHKSLRSHPFMHAVTISSVQPYARVQQEGGTVKSKRPNGYLAIPLRPTERRLHMWPRHWKSELLCIKREDSKLYLYSAKVRDFVYRLVKQVRIPPRPYLVKSDHLLDFMRRLLADKLKRL